MWKPKQPKSLKQALVKATINAVVGTGLIGASMFVSQQTVNADLAPLPEQDAPAQIVEKPRANVLVENKCRPYAEGSIPEHAVVTLPGHKAQYVKSDVGFALWGADLEYGTADDLPGQLHAFCR